MEFFAGAGWHVVSAKYGRRLQAAFAEPGGDALRAHIDQMSNEEYQSLFAHRGAGVAAALPQRRRSRPCSGVLDERADDDVAPLVLDLGGHDLGLLIDSYRSCDDVADRPSVVFAYTIKGWGLPMAGDPLNHSLLLSGAQIDELRASVGLDVGDEWARFDPDGPEGRRCASVGGELNNVPVSARPDLAIPVTTGVRDDRSGLDPGSVRADADPPGRHRRRGRAHRHRLAGRQRLDQPRWVDQQGRGLHPERAHRLRLRRWWRASPAALAPVAGGAPRRARHQRDEPLPAAAHARDSATSCTTTTCCRSAPSTTRSSVAGWTR